MFHRDTSVQHARCKNYSAYRDGWCKSFDMSFISSNNPEFFIAKKGYVICKHNLEYKLVLAYVSFQVDVNSFGLFITSVFTQDVFQTAIDGRLAEKCKNSSLYIPKTENDLKEVLATTMIDHLEQPVRIWTDFERLNKTHFWSRTAESWWANLDQNEDQDVESLWTFKDSVTFNGHRKLKNFSPRNPGCCVCVSNLHIKRPMKWLIFCLIASLVFAISGVIYRKFL